MWLIHTNTLALEEFHGASRPPFAILSHRWTSDEVTFQQFADKSAKDKPGYKKIEQFCYLAANEGLQFAWIDTCCIDKTSSAELTEAINSMYSWYSDAHVCYVYLQDVLTSSVGDDDSFETSDWFTRAWTLQELIAPADVVFYNAKWTKLGTKQDLRNLISRITNIQESVLYSGDFSGLSIAQRMSWAARRAATREEDIAYSLLGIFRVNMPLLYGEGKRAFIRLQEEIIKYSNDQTIFAWECDSSDDDGGMLASSPHSFRHCSHIVESKQLWYLQPYSITNRGLSIQLRVVPWNIDTYFVALDCEEEGVPDSRKGIFLRLTNREEQFARSFYDYGSIQNFNDFFLYSESTSKQIYIRQGQGNTPREDRLYGFWIKTLPGEKGLKSSPSGNPIRAKITKVMTQSKLWSNSDRIVEIPLGEAGTAAALYLDISIVHKYPIGRRRLWLGFDSDFNPMVRMDGESGRVLQQLDNTWMEEDAAAGHELIKGDRVRGDKTVVFRAEEYENATFVFKFANEIVGNRRMWTFELYLQEYEPIHYEACKKCYQTIRGISYKCRRCKDINFCANCATVPTRHAAHGWDKFVMKNGKPVRLKEGKSGGAK